MMNKFIKQPNPKSHFIVSMLKSCLRIMAGYWLIESNFELAGVNFIIAEVLGILEEMV